MQGRNSILKNIALENIVEFNGVLDYNTMDSLINQVESEMQRKETIVSVRKKVVNIVIECIENIYKHSKLIESEYYKNNYPVKFILAESINDYVVEIKNVIDVNSEKIIAQKLNFVNYVDKTTLKDAYSNIISKGEISEKGGAGLGLIDVALKSGNPVDYHFLPIDEIYSYFEMSVSISKVIKNEK